MLVPMRFAFTKYHALGNDYLVIDPKNLPSALTPDQVKVICHRQVQLSPLLLPVIIPFWYSFLLL